MNDPTNWNVDATINSFAAENPEMAKEIARRWNAYPGLIAMLRECLPIVERSIDLSVNVYPAQIGLLVAIKQALGE